MVAACAEDLGALLETDLPGYSWILSVNPCGFFWGSLFKVIFFHPYFFWVPRLPGGGAPPTPPPRGVTPDLEREVSDGRGPRSSLLCFEDRAPPPHPSAPELRANSFPPACMSFGLLVQWGRGGKRE